MFWRKKKNPEDQMPWYRRRGYKGDLTEDEKSRTRLLAMAGSATWGASIRLLNTATYYYPTKFEPTSASWRSSFTTNVGRFLWGEFSSQLDWVHFYWQVISAGSGPMNHEFSTLSFLT